MNEISFRCEHCGEEMETPAKHGGKEILCLSCNQPVQIPVLDVRPSKHIPIPQDRGSRIRAGIGLDQDDEDGATAGIVVKDIRVPFSSVFFLTCKFFASWLILSLIVAGLMGALAVFFGPALLKIVRPH